MIYDIKVFFLFQHKVLDETTWILDRGARDFDVLLFTSQQQFKFLLYRRIAWDDVNDLFSSLNLWRSLIVFFIFGRAINTSSKEFHSQIQKSQLKIEWSGS